MKTIKTSTNVFPIVDVGMYNSYWSPGYNFEHEFEADDLPEELEEKYWDEFDNDAYAEALGKLADAAIQTYFDGDDSLGALKQYGVTKIETGKIVSPREYNFRTDELDIDITMQDDTPERIAKKLLVINKKDGSFEKYLKDNFTSYDGFLSYVTNNMFEFIQEVREGYDREIAIAMYFLLKHEHDFHRDSLEDFMLENALGNGFLTMTEFCSDKTASEIYAHI